LGAGLALDEGNADEIARQFINTILGAAAGAKEDYKG